MDSFSFKLLIFNFITYKDPDTYEALIIYLHSSYCLQQFNLKHHKRNKNLPIDSLLRLLVTALLVWIFVELMIVCWVTDVLYSFTWPQLSRFSRSPSTSASKRCQLLMALLYPLFTVFRIDFRGYEERENWWETIFLLFLFHFFTSLGSRGYDTFQWK